MRAVLLSLALILPGATAQAEDRPQPSPAPPPGPAYRTPSMLSPPSVVIDPTTGTSNGGPRDRQSDTRGIPQTTGDRPPGLAVQPAPPPPVRR